MRAPVLITLLLLGAPALAAEEPSGCDKFKWPTERERAALTAPDRLKIASGADLNPTLPVTATMSLRPSAEANLPTTPERMPAANTFSGFAAFKNALPPGRYTINLSAAGWIDVVQDGKLSQVGHIQRREGLRRNSKEREIRNSAKTFHHPDFRRRGRLHQPGDRAGFRVSGICSARGTA